MNKPSFFCVGFAKCGTATLYRILKQHPDIFLSNLKEPWYYGKPEIYEKGFSWYINRFYSDTQKKKIVGEINPQLSEGSIAKKLYNDFGNNLKLIFIMRNPVERLFSHYKMDLNCGFDFERLEDHRKYSYQVGFSKYIMDNLKRDLDGKLVVKSNKQIAKFYCGKYNKVIKEYLRYFPLENMKCIIFEEFIKEKESIVKEILQFLNLPDDIFINYALHANEGNRIPRSNISIKINRWTLMSVWKWYMKDCKFTNNNLDKLMYNIKMKINILCTKKSEDCSNMNQRCKHLLEEFYKDDVTELSTLINKDLSELWFRY